MIDHIRHPLLARFAPLHRGGAITTTRLNSKLPFFTSEDTIVGEVTSAVKRRSIEWNNLLRSTRAETNAIICAYEYILALERELVQICTQPGSGAASTRIT